MLNVHTVFLAIATISELLAAIGWPESRLNLVAFGLFFYFLGMFVA